MKEFNDETYDLKIFVREKSLMHNELSYSTKLWKKLNNVATIFFNNLLYRQVTRE